MSDPTLAIKEAVDTYLLACSDVLHHVNRPSNVTNALRKLYHAREQLRHTCQELGLKLDAAKQKLQLIKAERLAAEAAAAAIAAAAVKAEAPQEEPPLHHQQQQAQQEQQQEEEKDASAAWPDSLLADDPIPDLPPFDFGSLDFDLPRL